MFLSIYVEDLKMAGKARNLQPLWKELAKLLILEPPKKLVDNQYLGCAQHNPQPSDENIERMGAAFEKNAVKKGDSSARSAHPE